MDMGRSTLKYKNFPHELWEEAINTSAYLLNWALQYEFWIRVKPNVEHVKVFGSIVYVKILEEKLQSCKIEASI